MIFRSRRRSEPAETGLTEDGTTENGTGGSTDLDREPSSAGPDTESAAAEEPDEPGAGDEPAGESMSVGGTELTEDELADLDAGDWRADGPYDIAEVDADELDDPDADPPVIDLGSMVLTAMAGMELRLQVDENTQQIVSAMMIHGDSALEVGPFAAPRSGGLWAEIRSDLTDAAHTAGGSANLTTGPFGVELRRLLPVRTPDGDEGYQPSRMWVAEGPRWMLRGIVYGQAALEDGLDSPAAEMLEAFQQIVVRRGDEPMAPGDLLPLTLPENMAQQDQQTAVPQER